MALPDSTSHEPAPEKKPVTLSLTPVTVLYTPSTPFDAAVLMPSQQDERAPDTVSHAPCHVLLMVPSTDEMTDATALMAVSTTDLMPFQTVDAMDLMPSQTPFQSPLMAAMTTAITLWMTPITACTTAEIAPMTVATTVESTGQTAFQTAWMSGRAVVMVATTDAMAGATAA